jgi:hypothetical protein
MNAAAEQEPASLTLKVYVGAANNGTAKKCADLLSIQTPPLPIQRITILLRHLMTLKPKRHSPPQCANIHL